jgi:hypothetical protein
MEIQEGMGGCFWLFMSVLFIVGLVTLPIGLLVWALQLYLLWRVGKDE